MKRIINYILIVLLLFLIITGCEDEAKETNNPADIDIPTSIDWTALESNPIINMGDQLSGAQWNDPSILKENLIYVMYLTANYGDQGENVIPFRATSNDGIIWDINPTPVLSTGENTSNFDYAKVETPSVVYFNGLYHMYYTGVQTDLSGILCIGHATSEDGLSWVKDPSNPIISPTGDIVNWNGAQVGEPGAVVFNEQIYLYFTAVGLRPDDAQPMALRTIGLAISSDGSIFDVPQKVLEQCFLYPASSNYEGYSTPSALVFNGNIHLFFDVVMINEYENPDWIQVAIHHAVSSDGINWIQDDLAIFKRSSFGWTSREIRAPSIIHDGNLFKMWFSGDNFIEEGIWGIGYATADDNTYQ